MNPQGEALRRYAALVDDRVGVVAAVQRPDRDAGDPPVHIALSIPSRSGPPGAAGGAKTEGAGAALDWERACVKALGESAERYAAGFPPADSVPGAARDLTVPHVEPELFALFSEEQYATGAVPFQRFTGRTPVVWEPATGLAGGGETWVPSCFVRFPHVRAAGEARLWTGITTGLAAGTRTGDALVSALCEVVERDAFMLFWRHARPAAGIDLSSLPHDPHQRLLEALAAAGMRCSAYLITQDIEVPVILLCLRSATGAPPYLLLAAGCHPDPDRACRLALEEGCLCLFGTRRLRRRLPRPGPDGHRRPDSLVEQGLAFAYDRSYLPLADGLLPDHRAGLLGAGELRARFRPPAGGAAGPLLARLTGALGPWAQHACYVDLTTVDLREAGLYAVRAVIPGLVPLDHDSTRPHLGGSRIGARPVRHGPHPFP